MPSPVIRALAAMVVLAAGPALAQSAPAKSPAGDKPVARKDAPPLHGAASFCDRYGAGFVRVEGTDTCIRASGTVETNAYVTGGSGTVRGSAIAPALRSQ